jgi:hypothetical protein
MNQNTRDSVYLQTGGSFQSTMNRGNTFQDDQSTAGDFSFRQLLRNIVRLSTVSHEPTSEGTNLSLDESWATFSRYITGQNWVTTEANLPTPVTSIQEKPTASIQEEETSIQEKPSASESGSMLKPDASIPEKPNQSTVLLPLCSSSSHVGKQNPSVSEKISLSIELQPSSKQKCQVTDLQLPVSSQSPAEKASSSQGSSSTHEDIPSTIEYNFDDLTVPSDELERIKKNPFFYFNYVLPHLNAHRAQFNDVDVFAWQHQKRYPMFTCSFACDSDDMPELGWSRTNIRTKKYKRRWKCLGVNICPQEGCRHRRKACVPRRGKGKYNSGGKIPTASGKDKCTKHTELELVHMSCEAYWYIEDLKDDPSNKWMVHHFGEHHHPAPFPIHVSKDALKVMAQWMMVDPSLTPQSMLQGNAIRPPVGNLDINLCSADRVSYQREKLRRTVYNEVVGNSKAFDSLHMTLSWFNELQEKNPDAIRKHHLPDKDHNFTGINFQTDVMEMVSVSNLSGKQVDTVMSLTETTFLKQPTYVTITSSWNFVLQRQFPCLVTFHTGQSAEAYQHLHFDIENEGYQRQGISFKDIDDFYDKYSGYTMDFSSALSNGWLNSLNCLVEKQFGTTARVSQRAHEAMKRFCQVHYKGNVSKVANISFVVPPKRITEFKNLCWAMLDDIPFSEFQVIVKRICRNFKHASGWIKWYLNEKIAPHIFPACNCVPSDDRLAERLNSLSKDTNAQEGLGGSMSRVMVLRTRLAQGSKVTKYENKRCTSGKEGDYD